MRAAILARYSVGHEACSAIDLMLRSGGKVLVRRGGEGRYWKFEGRDMAAQFEDKYGEQNSFYVFR